MVVDEDGPKRPTTGVNQATRRSTEAEAQVAIAWYRFMISRYASNRAHWFYRVKVVFLCQKGKDPDKAIARQLSDCGMPVRPQSRATVKRYVVDKVTGEPGVILNLNAVKWQDNSHVIIEGGYYQNPRGVMKATFTLERSNVGWVVQKVENVGAG